MLKRTVLAIVFTVLIAGSALAGKAEIIPGTRTKNVHVPGIILCGRDYFETAERAIREAKESICVAMYIINVSPEPDANPASTLLEDLIDAKKRGLNVKVILDNSMLNVNYNAYKRLRQAGVDVYMDNSRAVLHGKGMVIDSNICIIGSFNWTRAALYDNYEFAVYTEDPQQAKKLLDYISRIGLSPQPPIQPQEFHGPRLPISLLTSSTGPRLSPLLASHAEKAFDLYLYLLRKARSQNSSTLKLDYREFSRAMGYIEYSKHSVSQILECLIRKHGLIRHKPWSKYLEIDAAPETDYIIIPDEYWDYGFNKDLNFTEKYMFLISLCEAQGSAHNPYWFRSNQGLIQIYHISKGSIVSGITGLERENILEVERDKPEESKGFDERLANRYCLNPLRSQEQFRQALDALSEKYGAQVIAQARELSAQLGEPKDPEKIEVYAGLIGAYGYERVKAVNSEVAAKHRQSGFRSLEQVILLLNK